jgi:DNA-binding MarR family transcriptional regulator
MSKNDAPAAASPPTTFYSGSRYVIDDSYGFLVRRLYTSLQRHVERRVQAHDLTALQWMPLLLLDEGKAKTCAEIARLMAIDTGAMTRMVDRLESKGLVRRMRSVDDRRVVDLELTDSGQLAAASIPDILAEVLNLHLSGFSAAEFAQLMNFLQRMIDNGVEADVS